MFTPEVCLQADNPQTITVIPRKNRLRIYVDGDDKYYRLREMKRGLEGVVVKVKCKLYIRYIVNETDFVQGVATIQRAVINIKDKDDERGKKGDKELLVEGYGLQKCMITEGRLISIFLCQLFSNSLGIIGEQTSSNHVIEVAKVLGIEAARRSIINEIQYTMKSHDMIIDPRHVMLLGDVMTYKVCCLDL